MANGFDVSHFQSDSQVRMAAGSDFVVVKTSDGMSTDNPSDPTHPAHDRQVAIVRSGSAVAGHYHFARVCSRAAAEADHFLQLANAADGDLVALDLENMDGSWAQRVAYAVTWLAVVEHAVGARPLRYVNQDWLHNLDAAATSAQRAALARYPLWIATAGKPAGYPGVSGWTVHQFSTAGGIDHDVLAAGVDLASLTIPGGDDMSAADVAAINAHTDRVFASLSHGQTPDGSARNGVGHDQLLAAVTGITLPPLSDAQVQAIATAVGTAVSKAVSDQLAKLVLVPKV